MTTTLQLKNEVKILIDSEDFNKISEFKYFIDNGYPTRWTTMVKGSRKKIKLHVDIMEPADGLSVDHINRDRLDNRRVNLRLCTHSKNMANKPMDPRNTSGYKGVAWSKHSSKWVAYITVNYKRLNLGYYSAPEEAAIAYNAAAQKHFGEFAYLNQVI